MTNDRSLQVERSTSTAHRLSEYDGVCSNLHGHNMKWDVELTVSMAGTGRDNMPLDLKTVSDMIDETDHAIILSISDPLFEELGIGFKAGTEFPFQDEIEPLGDVIVFDGDPTCEAVAQWMANRLVDEIEPVKDAWVDLNETDKYGVGAQSHGCTCGPNEGCSFCGGD